MKTEVPTDEIINVISPPLKQRFETNCVVILIKQLQYRSNQNGLGARVGIPLEGLQVH